MVRRIVYFPLINLVSGKDEESFTEWVDAGGAVMLCILTFTQGALDLVCHSLLIEKMRLLKKKMIPRILNDHISKNKHRKIDISFVSEHFETFWTKKKSARFVRACTCMSLARIGTDGIASMAFSYLIHIIFCLFYSVALFLVGFSCLGK